MQFVPAMRRFQAAVLSSFASDEPIGPSGAEARVVSRYPPLAWSMRDKRRFL